MKSNLSILFYPKKDKRGTSESANIYIRITVDGKRSEMSIGRKVLLSDWNSDANRVRGHAVKVRELNSYMDSIRLKIYEIYRNLLDKDETITSKKIKDIYNGKVSSERMLLKMFQEHNDRVDSLIGKDFAEGTAERYKTAKMHVENYIKSEYGKEDIPVKRVDHKFISGFEYYLKTKKRACSHNTAVKYITNFKKIIRIAYSNGWIDSDPFFNWKSRLKIVDREFLTENELQKLIQFEIRIPRIDQVKDIFIFSCYTGLAYIDVKRLKKKDIVIGVDGESWIQTKRTKTDVKTNIPLLPTAKAIIEKYSDHPSVINSEYLLPVLSNQKMNAYLKEIADLCDINKNLTYHLARHTFATTITLNNGVPIESVSKMLGHRSLKTTQHYAKILDRKVSQDMAALKDRLGN